MTVPTLVSFDFSHTEKSTKCNHILTHLFKFNFIVKIQSMISFWSRLKLLRILLYYIILKDNLPDGN